MKDIKFNKNPFFQGVYMTYIVDEQKTNKKDCHKIGNLSKSKEVNYYKYLFIGKI